MADMRDIRSIVDAAERAAAEGDYPSAEGLLREAAREQESSLGPLHPDLANTLNNLGIVCEITDKPDEAEGFFRRACDIAGASLEPDHPFVSTSRRNLEDFCVARGRAVVLPAPTGQRPTTSDRAAVHEADAASDSAGEPVNERPVFEGPQQVVEPISDAGVSPAAKGRTFHRASIGVLVASAVLVALMGTARWFRSNEAIQSPPSRVSASAPETTTPAPPRAADRGAADRSAETDSTISEASSPPPSAERQAPAPSAPSAVGTPVVTAARLCSDLSTRGTTGDWECVPPTPPAGPGRLFFYTRLRSAADTTVQHRWYRDGRLRQSVELPIRTNTSSGYRTYSRHTVDAQDAAEWRVELRASDGTVLYEERLVVR